jgi:hypothetical protein
MLFEIPGAIIVEGCSARKSIARYNRRELYVVQPKSALVRPKAGSVQHFVFTFFTDQLLEVHYDLVTSSHHSFNLILVKIWFSLFRQ